jgi:small subunit ribosomal protein S20
LASSGEKEALHEATRTAVKALDKAAERGIIHKNQAARRKSRLMKTVNTIE